MRWPLTESSSENDTPEYVTIASPTGLEKVPRKGDPKLNDELAFRWLTECNQRLREANHQLAAEIKKKDAAAKLAKESLNVFLAKLLDFEMRGEITIATFAKTYIQNAIKKAMMAEGLHRTPEEKLRPQPKLGPEPALPGT